MCLSYPIVMHILRNSVVRDSTSIQGENTRHLSPRRIRAVRPKLLLLFLSFSSNNSITCSSPFFFDCAFGFAVSAMAFISLSSSPSPPAPNDSCSSKNPFEELRSLAFVVVVALAISALPEYPPNPNVVVVVVAPVRRLELLDAAVRWVWGRCLPPMLSTTTKTKTKTTEERVSSSGDLRFAHFKIM